MTPPDAAATPTLWRHGDFLKLWAAQSVSLLGTQVTALALPLTAILKLHASAVQVGALGAVQYLPFLLVSLPAGAIVDRLRRLPVLVGTDVARAVLVIAVPVAAWSGVLGLGWLYPIAFLVGALSVFFDVAHQSLLPTLVAPSQLLEGNTKLQLSYSAAQLGGPALGGVLVQWLTAPVALVADAASYVSSAVLLLTIKKRPEPQRPANTDSPQNADSPQNTDSPQNAESPPDGGMMRRLVGDIREGLRFVGRHPLIRPLALATGAANFFYLYGMTGAVLTLYAVRELRLSPALLGVALAVGNVGAIAGSLAADRVLRSRHFGTVMIVGAASAAVPIALMAVATRGSALIVLSAAVLLGEFAITVYNIAQLSLRQAATPTALLGRMNATVRFVIWGPIPAGAFLGGVLGSAIGLRPTLWVAAAGSVLPALPLLASRIRTLHRLPAADQGTYLDVATEVTPVE